MLIASSPFTNALTPHAASRSWIVFLQSADPSGMTGPIKIEGMRGNIVGQRIRQLCADCPYELIIIGLIESGTPVEHAAVVMQQFAGAHLHDGWFRPSADLITFIQRNASAPLQGLIAQVYPGAFNADELVDIDQMAAILGVSEKTIRRMVKANEIPFMRLNQALRFEPQNVIAALQRGK